MLMIILALAALLRLWGTFDNTLYQKDEIYQVPTAISLAKYGTTVYQEWKYPQLPYLIISGMINLLGDNPYGWRTANVIFSISSVLLLYMIGVQLYPKSLVPILAATFLAFDPLHIFYSRFSTQEMPVVFFFLLYLFLMLEFSEKGKSTLHLSGIALGLTAATKAYFLMAIPIVGGYAFYCDIRRRGLSLSPILDFAVALLVLPLAVYLLSYIHWFGRGYNLSEFLLMKRDAVWYLQQLKPEYYDYSKYLMAGGRPWEWFLKPLVFGSLLFSDGGQFRAALEINNFPFLLLVVPSFLITGYYALKNRVIREMLPLLIFLACYLLFLAVKKPIFSYSSIVVLPFAYLFVARAVDLAASMMGNERGTCTFFIVAAAAWGLYTFPLVTGMIVPVSLYYPVLSIAKLF